MPFLNFYVGRMAYADAAPLQNPKQKFFDFVTAKEGLSVSSPVSLVKEILPGQTVLLDSTARTIASGLNTSQFAISFIGSDIGRLRWTGVGPTPAFRAARPINYGTVPATTTYAASRLSANSVQITLSGAGVDLSSALVGDELYFQGNDTSFTSPLNTSSINQRFLILSSTVSSVIIRDNGSVSAETAIVLGANFDSVLRIFSTAGVQIGDKFRIADASAFNLENKSSDLEVLQVSDRDIHFYNPNLIAETVVAGVSSPFAVFDRLINFVSIEASGPIKLKFNDGTEEIQLKEFTPGSAMFVSTLNAISIHAVNSTNYPITVAVQSCSF